MQSFYVTADNVMLALGNTRLACRPAVIVESTIALAHNLGLSVVAEGIEDARTEARLRALGCDEGQGFLFGRPMPAATALAWLDAFVP